MGGLVKKPKAPPPPPPPPAPRDEADAVNLATLMAQRASVAGKGFRRAFLSGPRGPGGPEWQAPETPAASPAPTPLTASTPNPRDTGELPGAPTRLLTRRPGRPPTRTL